MPVLAVGLALGMGAKRMQAQTAAPANQLPDILGMRTGMAPGDAYNLLKAHDPAHSVTLEQLGYPQLYGDKPITYGMNTATSDSVIEMIVKVISREPLSAASIGERPASL